MIIFSGHDRTYTVPAPLVAAAQVGRATAWDLLTLSTSNNPDLSAWAGRVVASVVAKAESASESACPDCQDEGFYGLTSPDDSDVLRGLVRETESDFERLTSSGWEPFDLTGAAHARILTRDEAVELAAVIAAGGDGLVLRHVVPIAWLPPTNEHPALTITAAAEAADDSWREYAIVDELDHGAVLNLIRLTKGPKLETYTTENGWTADSSLLAALRGVDPPMLVELDPTLLASVTEQIDAAAAVTAGVSPDLCAEKLRRYWSVGGKGGLKIKWGLPGDWKRCVRYLSKYMGPRAKGYCQNMHKRNTGVWTGSKLNASGTWPTTSVEASLYAGIMAGAWTAPTGKVNEMKDGIYSEVLDAETELLDAVVAGGFPVAPPDEWFANPKLAGPTPLTVEASGQVYGHIATFDVAHIGMAGKVYAPKSRSDYAFFKTGELVTASGAKVSVGNLTLAGGHAPLSADAHGAVAHYDDTASAVADLNIGEDRFGIWVAGALRQEATTEQVRALRASAPSGDWRPINGNLELVAICQVNVPGFPVTRARVASGAVMALVAAGARPLAEQRLAALANEALSARLNGLEAALIAAGIVPAMEAVDNEADDDAPEVETAPDVEADVEAEVEAAPEVETEDANPITPDEPDVSDKVAALREEIRVRRAERREALRARAHASVAASGAGDVAPKA